MEGTVQSIHLLSDFKTLVNSGRAVIVDFYASWCGPCKLLSPRLETLSKEHLNITFVKVDVDNATELAEEYLVSAMPTVIGFHAGEKIDTVVGFNNTKITELVQSLSKLSSGSQDNGFNSTVEYNQVPMMSGGSAPLMAKTNVTSNEDISGENLNYVYLKAKFSDFTTNFSKVVIKVSTRDQGWATVDGSNSFFDLRIVDQNGILLAEKGRIITNYCETQYSNKTFTLNRSDSDLGRYMVGGNTLQVVARSEYPGWKNYVNYGEISFE